MIKKYFSFLFLPDALFRVLLDGFTFVKHNNVSNPTKAHTHTKWPLEKTSINMFYLRLRNNFTAVTEVEAEAT
jgi:hypothetical protein